MSSPALTILAFLCYAAAIVCYGETVFVKRPAGADNDAFLPRGRGLLAAGILAQFAGIGAWCTTIHRSPFASSYGTLAITAWLVTIVFFLMERRTRVSAVGVVALLIACVLLFWAVLRSNGPVAQSPVLAGEMVSIHVMAVVASFALFTIACACAVLYIVQDHLLKGTLNSTLFRRIPPLATLDSAAYRSVMFALPLLTLGLAIGIARTFGAGAGHTPREWLLDPKTLASVATWLLYVGYLCARRLLGWRGVRLQYMLIVGMSLTMALYFIPTSTHQFA